MTRICYASSRLRGRKLWRQLYLHSSVGKETFRKCSSNRRNCKRWLCVDQKQFKNWAFRKRQKRHDNIIAIILKDILRCFHRSLRSWRDSGAGERAAEPPCFLAKPAMEFTSGDSSPILSRLGHSCSRLLYQNKSTRARNPASYAGYFYRRWRNGGGGTSDCGKTCSTLSTKKTHRLRNMVQGVVDITFFSNR